MGGGAAEELEDCGRWSGDDRMSRKEEDRPTDNQEAA